MLFVNVKAGKKFSNVKEEFKPPVTMVDTHTYINANPSKQTRGIGLEKLQRAICHVKNMAYKRNIYFGGLLVNVNINPASSF